MGDRFRRLPSPAMAVAFIALLAALGGTAVALPGSNTVTSGDIKNSQVKTQDIKNSTVRGGDVRANTLTGSDVSESTLGKVPTAANADNAANAANADKVDGKDASELTGAVLSTPSVSNTSMPASTTTTIASLNLPAGSYLVTARAAINSNDAAASLDEIDCSLLAGGQTQNLGQFNLGANGTVGETEEASWLLGATLNAPGQAVLSCTSDAGWVGNVLDSNIVAIAAG